MSSKIHSLNNDDSVTMNNTMKKRELDSPLSSDKKQKIDADVGREKRLEQNRLAARASRNRKKAMVEKLRRSVLFFTQANQSLRNQNDELARHLTEAEVKVAAIEEERTVRQRLLANAHNGPILPDCESSDSIFSKSMRSQPLQVIQNQELQQQQERLQLQQQLQLHFDKNGTTQTLRALNGLPPASVPFTEIATSAAVRAPITLPFGLTLPAAVDAASTLWPLQPESFEGPLAPMQAARNLGALSLPRTISQSEAFDAVATEIQRLTAMRSLSASVLQLLRQQQENEPQHQHLHLQQLQLAGFINGYK